MKSKTQISTNGFGRMGCTVFQAAISLDNGENFALKDILLVDHLASLAPLMRVAPRNDRDFPRVTDG